MLFGWSGKVGGERLQALRAPKALFGVRCPTLLVWLMRALALIWLAKGLLGWGGIIGALGPADAFQKASLAQQTAIVFFAVLDLIAGTGLWMTAGWGGGVWLMAMGAHMALAIIMPRAISLSPGGFVAYLALAALFVLLAWAAAHHDDK